MRNNESARVALPTRGARYGEDLETAPRADNLGNATLTTPNALSCATSPIVTLVLVFVVSQWAIFFSDTSPS
jgi:hypothetical protein